MKYLLDTNIIINHLRGEKIIDKTVIEKGAAISVISYGEILYGAYKSQNKEENLNRIRILISKLSLQIINLDKEIIKIFAQLKSSLELKGQKLDDFDLLIGATSIANFFTLQTDNIKHFQRISGLKLNN